MYYYYRYYCLLYYRYCQIVIHVFEYRKYWYYRYYLQQVTATVHFLVTPALIPLTGPGITVRAWTQLTRT